MSQATRQPRDPPAPPEPAVTAGSGLLLNVLLTLGATALLWALHLYGRTLTEPALILVWFVMTALLATGLFIRARIRRRAFLLAYLHADSAIARRWRGGVVMAVRVCLLAGLLAAVLIVALLRIETTAVWVALIAAALMLAPLHACGARALAGQANPVWLTELAWRIAIAVVGLLLMAALAALAYHQPQPELGGVRLDSAVWYFVERESARSELAGLLLELAAAKDGLKYWLGQQLLPQPGVSFTQAAGWAVILAEEALFVWSYLSLLSATLIAREHIRTHQRSR